jgi:hypothetical protein
MMGKRMDAQALLLMQRVTRIQHALWRREFNGGAPEQEHRFGFCVRKSELVGDNEENHQLLYYYHYRKYIYVYVFMYTLAHDNR